MKKVVQKVIQRKPMQPDERTEWFNEFVDRVTDEANKLINDNDIEIKSISYPDLYTAVIVLISYEEK